MYFYNLSQGEYSDYSCQVIMHEKKFTKKEFIEMYNQIVLYTKAAFDDEVAEKMCEKHGFKLVKEEIEINCGYGYFTPITDDAEIEDDDCIFIRVEGSYND